MSSPSLHSTTLRPVSGKRFGWIPLAVALTLISHVCSADPSPFAGKLIVETIESTLLRGTATGVDPVRQPRVYLPHGYESSGKSYPVVYLLHSIFQSPEQLLTERGVIPLTERAVANAVVKEFILVVGDYRGPMTGSLYENTEATGRWLDHTVQELVPHIDRRYRTLRRPESRALVGEMMGGRGAFQLAMHHPDVFGVLYALNPVGTAPGLLPVQTYPNWNKILNARSADDLQGDHISQIFVMASRAFLPNPDRPPFQCDFLMELKDGVPAYHSENALRFIDGFLIYHQPDDAWRNLGRLRAIAFDWSRYDPIQDHVAGCVSLSRKLETFGIAHEAEEYRGVYWSENWSENGRYSTRVLPFLNRHLDFSTR